MHARSRKGLTSSVYSLLQSRRLYAALVLVLLPFAANAEPIKVKFAFFASDREFAYRGIVKPFADAVNLEGNGAIEIELYPGGALGRNYAEQVDLVLSGGADIAWIHPALTPERFPDNAVMELPGLFRDVEEATQVYTRVAGAGLLRGDEDLLLLGTFASDPVTIHMRMPIASLEDLKDKKIRASNSTQIVALRALGMQPESMPINQTSDAINRGAIDGASTTLETLQDFGVSRFATNHYMLGIGSVPLMIVINRKKFDSLPEAAQGAIRKYSGEWLNARYVDTIRAYGAEILKKLNAASQRSVVDPSPSDRASARSIFDAVKMEWAARSPRNSELLKLVETEISKHRSTQ